MNGLTLFAGWDVAGWTCPSGPQTATEPKSQDALVVLAVHDGVLSMQRNLVGNFASSIAAGDDLIRGALPTLSTASVVLAIDAPLGWPTAFQDLLAWSRPAVACTAYSQLLYRETDRIHKAQSAVVRSVGAASTKALAYLQSRAFHRDPTRVGIFCSDGDTAIETYPRVVREHAAANPDGLLAVAFSNLQGKLDPQGSDADAALWCALIAAAWAHAVPGVPPLVPPGKTTPAVEGWIWAPEVQDITPSEATDA